MPDSTSALRLVLTADPSLVSIVKLSLGVSLTAVAVAAIALSKFRGREFVIVVLNALMGLPPVVVGLLVYLLDRLCRCR